MVAGHFATALIAHQKYPKGSLLFFLVASQLQDLLWFTFHYLGIEPTTPSDFLGATLKTITVDMIYSHDLLTQLFWAGLVFVIGKLLFKNNKTGMVGAILVLGHFFLDFISGYPHHIFGADTHQVGLGLYYSNVYLAILIEAITIGILLWYFFKEEAKRGINRTSKNKMSLIGLFVFGVVFLILSAEKSIRSIFNIPEYDLSINTTVPTLIITYVVMILYLNHFVRKVT